MGLSLHSIRDFAGQSFRQWNAHNAWRLSAALAYYTVFSLGPILLLAVAIAGFVFGKDAASGELAGQLRSLLGAQGAKAVQSVLAGTKNDASNLLASLISVVILIFGATGVFTELKSALNLIWEAKPPPVSGIRSLIKDRLLSFALVAAICFILLVSLIVSAVVSAASKYASAYLPFSSVLFDVLSFAASFALITVLFGLIFKILPDVELHWRDVWVGAATTSVLFTLGKQLIGLYLGQSSAASAYGASGSVVVVLLWAYYSSLILYLGAEFTHVYTHRCGSRATGRSKDGHADDKASRS